MLASNKFEEVKRALIRTGKQKSSIFDIGRLYDINIINRNCLGNATICNNFGSGGRVVFVNTSRPLADVKEAVARGISHHLLNHLNRSLDVLAIPNNDCGSGNPAQDDQAIELAKGLLTLA